MAEKKNKSGFWKRIFRVYEVSFMDRIEKSIVRHHLVSHFGLFMLALLLVFVGMGLAVLLTMFTPFHGLFPDFVNTETRQQIVDTALKIDSLQEAVDRQRLYIMNIQDIFQGRVRVDSVGSIDSLTVMRSEELMERTEREKEFTRQFEESEKYNLTSQASTISEVQGLNLFCPARGTLGEGFDPNNYHFGVDIVADPNANVMATLDGTVLLSSYTANMGYVVVVQHKDDLVSVYMFCGGLLKKAGDKVKTGEAIALVGKTGLQTSGPHLHFELWHKGIPLDPTRYLDL